MLPLLLTGALVLATPEHFVDADKMPTRMAVACRIKRDAEGAIVRDRAARAAFRKMTGYPKGRPGYVADHVIPIVCCGADKPGNFQWLPEAEWAAKSRWERQPCSAWWDGSNTRLLQWALDGCATGRTPKELCR